MLRRSARLAAKGRPFPDGDAASTSSTGSTGHISYNDNPTRTLKRSGRRSTGSVSRNSSRASSVSQILTGQRSEFTATEKENGMTFVTLGLSSGYSSAEERYEQSIKSNPSKSASQALVLVMLLYCCLERSLFGLISGLSLVKVFLLSRCTSKKRKAVMLVLLTFLLFGIWRWFPFAPHSSPPEDVSKTPSVKQTDHLQYATLSDLKVEIASLREKEVNLMKDIELLKMESMKYESESIQTDLESMNDQMMNAESEHEQQIAELKSSISNLQSAQDLLKDRADAQDTLNANLRAELYNWLINLLKDPSSFKSAVVFRSELQRGLEDLEKRMLDKLAHEKESRRDVWRTVGGTPQQEGDGAVTIQDVNEIVHRAVSLYRADGIGLADYALGSSGASVLNTRCSKPYMTRRRFIGIPLWYRPESPRTVIQPEVYPGKCWAFQGSQGFLAIALSYPVRITHVTLEHLPKELSPTGRIDSAPKDFAVYGMSDENEEGKLLGTFTYDQDGEPIQTFKLAEASEIYSMTELRILSNWGHPDYTCVYRFRVHGEPSIV